MKTGVVLKEICFVLIVVGLLAATLAVDRQFYQMRQEASAQFGNFQRIFWLMSVSRLVTAVFLMILIWLTVMREQGGLIFSLFCLILGLFVVFNVPLDFAISSFSISQLFGFSFGAITFGNSLFSEVGAMLAVIGVWRLGQIFLQRRRVAA